MKRAAWAIEELARIHADLVELLYDIQDPHRSRIIKIGADLERVLGQMRGEDREERIQYVADKREKEAEAQAEATRIIQGIRHARMTPGERRAEAERDNDLLFGTEKERTTL